MSPRRWLEKWPLRLRALVLVLGLLQLVAPSWHVCALGGHILHCGTSQTNTEAGPVICFCRADLESEDAKYARAWPSKLTDAADGDVSPFCLARFLQTQPGQAAIVAAPVVISLEVGLPRFVPRHETALQRQAVVIRGRGPPSLC